MKVLMVGHSGAGKTSFMAGLYTRLGDETSGYGMRATEPQQHAQLQRLADGLAKGQYPAGTDVQSSYLFTFMRNGKSVMPIEWVDYRGGALASADEHDKELKQLADDIASSDALIVFLDGTKLEKLSWETQCEFDTITSCIELALGKSRPSWLPISMVITKSDLISPDDARLQGLSYFDSFFYNASRSDVLRVSLSRCVVNKTENEATVYPFLFAMQGMLPNYIEQCRKEEVVLKAKYLDTRPSNIIMILLVVIEQLLEWVFVLVSFLLQQLFKLVFGLKMRLWSWDTDVKRTTRAKREWKNMVKNRKQAEKRVLKVDKDMRKYMKKNKIKIYGK